MQLKAFGVALLTAAALSAPLVAHHSHGNYDLTTWTVMEGQSQAGRLHRSPFDRLSRRQRRRLGARSHQSAGHLPERGEEDVQVGDTIKVRCHLLRDGGKGCLLGFVTPMHGDKARGHGVEIEWD